MGPTSLKSLFNFQIFQAFKSMLRRQLWPEFWILQTKFLRQISTQNCSNLLTFFFCKIDRKFSQQLWYILQSSVIWWLCCPMAGLKIEGVLRGARVYYYEHPWIWKARKWPMIWYFTAATTRRYSAHLDYLGYVSNHLKISPYFWFYDGFFWAIFPRILSEEASGEQGSPLRSRCVFLLPSGE